MKTPIRSAISQAFRRYRVFLRKEFSAANLMNFRQFYRTCSDRAVSIGYPSMSPSAASDG